MLPREEPRSFEQQLAESCPALFVEAGGPEDFGMAPDPSPPASRKSIQSPAAQQAMHTRTADLAKEFPNLPVKTPMAFNAARREVQKALGMIDEAEKILFNAVSQLDDQHKRQAYQAAMTLRQVSDNLLQLTGPQTKLAPSAPNQGEEEPLLYGVDY